MRKDTLIISFFTEYPFQAAVPVPFQVAVSGSFYNESIMFYQREQCFVLMSGGSLGFLFR